MNFEGVRADEDAVTALLENVSALLTEGEQEQLRDRARRIAEANGESFAIIVGAAARRAGDSAQEVVNGREAGGRWFAHLTVPQVLEAMNDVVRPAN
jgi:hypothetical protein